MRKRDSALEYFSKGYNCSQSVLAAFAQDCGIDSATALKIACGFGAGMGRMQSTCGAVTGAIMVIGLIHGRPVDASGACREKTYSLVREFAREFLKRQGTLSCAELLSCDLSTPEGQCLFNERNLLDEVCFSCVKDAVAILEDIL
jgi:C_GCAxxG_C_C family probable redox protein